MIESPEEVAARYGAAVPAPMPSRAGHGKLIGAILVAGVGIGASALSCVGQSFSLRQARALEGIEQQVQLLRLQCGREVSR